MWNPSLVCVNEATRSGRVYTASHPHSPINREANTWCAINLLTLDTIVTLNSQRPSLSLITVSAREDSSYSITNDPCDFIRLQHLKIAEMTPSIIYSFIYRLLLLSWN